LPAVVQLDTREDIYALGDIHADYDRLVALLVTHKLLAAVPAQPLAAQWAAGHAVLVVTGDVIDKWTQGLKALTLVRSKGLVYQRFGMVFLTDVGLSQGVDYSKGALLRIQTTGTQTTATAQYADGTVTELWKG
jgi:hypothetical protein